MIKRKCFIFNYIELVNHSTPCKTMSGSVVMNSSSISCVHQQLQCLFCRVAIALLQAQHKNIFSFEKKFNGHHFLAHHRLLILRRRADLATIPSEATPFNGYSVAFTLHALTRPQSLPVELVECHICRPASHMKILIQDQQAYNLRKNSIGDE